MTTNEFLDIFKGYKVKDINTKTNEVTVLVASDKIVVNVQRDLFEKLNFKLISFNEHSINKFFGDLQLLKSFILGIQEVIINKDKYFKIEQIIKVK